MVSSLRTDDAQSVEFRVSNSKIDRLFGRVLTDLTADEFKVLNPL